MGVHLFALMLHSCYLSSETWYWISIKGHSELQRFHRVTARGASILRMHAFNLLQYMLAHLLKVSVAQCRLMKSLEL